MTNHDPSQERQICQQPQPDICRARLAEAVQQIRPCSRSISLKEEVLHDPNFPGKKWPRCRSRDRGSNSARSALTSSESEDLNIKGGFERCCEDRWNIVTPPRRSPASVPCSLETLALPQLLRLKAGRCFLHCHGSDDESCTSAVARNLHMYGWDQHDDHRHLCASRVHRAKAKPNKSTFKACGGKTPQTLTNSRIAAHPLGSISVTPQCIYLATRTPPAPADERTFQVCAILLNQSQQEGASFTSIGHTR